MTEWLIYNRYADNRGDLAMRLGYNATVFSAALTGRIPFSDKLAKKLCQYNKRLNLDWLLNEQGEMLLPEEGTAGARGRGATPAVSEEYVSAVRRTGMDRTGAYAGEGADRKMVPFYRDLRCTAGQTEVFDYNEASDHVCIPGVSADAFFPVSGRSMEPNINDGDMVGAKEMTPFEGIDQERIYVVITRNNERMIKHIHTGCAEDEQITLVSDNPDYAPFKVRKEDVVKVMKVVFIGKNV